ncbi:MAG TPA: PHP domain-containing protein [Gemmatimonadales bacterium]|nr:PHP domain-containing protein [Gemmatimonadales bacterium]
MHLDLHLHSTCSDGSLSPRDVVLAGRRAGLGMIALADHDTVAGVEPARAAAAAQGGIGVIPAAEFTCELDGAEVHLLGYALRADDPGIAAIARGAAEARRSRLAAMLERLRGLGVALTAEDVTAEPECVSIGRMHLARALVRHRVASSVSDAFTRFIGDRAPAFVPSRGPAVADAISAIDDAGGCAVWAHPSLEDARKFRQLKTWGLAGVEALRPSLDPVSSSAMEAMARAEGLFVTGGSDWHGGTRPALGSWFVTERHVGEFLERLGIPV